MNSTIALLLGFAFPLVLAVMGAWVSSKPPTTRLGHWIWIGAFFVIALPVVWSSYQQGTEIDDGYKKITGIAAKLNLPSTATLKEISKKIDKLSPHIYRVSAGTTYNVPNENCTVNVENSPNKGQTEIYLPKEPFQGQIVTIRNMRSDKSHALIEILGNGHKIGTGDKAYIVSESDAGGAGYLTMTFDLDQWSAAGLP